MLLYEKVIAPLHGLANKYEAGSLSSQEFDEGARDILEAIAENEGIRPEAEQAVAYRMLHVLLDDQGVSQEAIAHYASLLVQRKSPHAEVIYKALGALEGYWTKQEIAAAADASVMNAEAWLSGTEERMHISVDRRSVIGTAARDMAQLVE